VHARQAGTNLCTIAWATAVTYPTGRRSDLTRPAGLTPEGATMATDASDQEQQQRELEEIRRQFAEVGKRTGSAFEPRRVQKLIPSRLLGRDLTPLLVSDRGGRGADGALLVVWWAIMVRWTC